MNHSDMARGVDWITVRWGPQPAWRNADELVPDFAPYTAGALMQSLDDWYRAGQKFAPKPSELLKAVADTARRRINAGVDGVDTAPCITHRWADPSPTDDDRHRVCVLCGEVGPVAPHDHLFNTRGFCAYCNQVKEKTA